MKYKICLDCKRELPLTTEYFRTNKRGLDGFAIRCNECKPLKTSYYKKNREQLLAKQNNYAENNREDYLVSQALYRERNRNKRNEASKEWNELNNDRLKENFKRWRLSNPERMRGHNRYRQMNKMHEISEEEWENCKNYFNYRCAYCGLAIEDHFIQRSGKLLNSDFHREHVDHEGQNDLLNCVPSCRSCNSSKHTASLEDWYCESNKVFSNIRLGKINQWLDEDVYKYIEI